MRCFQIEIDLNAPFGTCMFTLILPTSQMIGDVTAPILRVVPFQPVANITHFYFEFVKLHYVPVAKSIIEQVKISIKVDTGNDVPLCTGKTLMDLHFRQRISKVILLMSLNAYNRRRSV